MTAAEKRSEVLRELLPELLDLALNQIMARRESFLRMPFKRFEQRGPWDIGAETHRYRNMLCFDPSDKTLTGRQVTDHELSRTGVMRIDLDVSITVRSDDARSTHDPQRG
jgi:hypothetical protein